MHRILLVEDNRAFREALTALLQEHIPALEVLAASDGDGAMAALAQRPELILMDVGLPGESGIELTRRVKALAPEVVVVVLTGYCLPEYRDAALHNGAAEFLCKDSTSPDEIVALAKGLWH